MLHLRFCRFARCVTTNYKNLGKNYFLKHTLSNGLVTSSEACFIKNDLLYCLIPNEYTNNQNLMANAFEDSEYKIYRTETECHDINVSVFAYTTGHVYVYPAGSSSQCVVRDDVSSYCYIS